MKVSGVLVEGVGVVVSVSRRLSALGFSRGGGGGVITACELLFDELVYIEYFARIFLLIFILDF